ncbi:bacterial peptide chain release factor 2 (bRF-2) [Hathewaya proteolytica DSM 3090]|uniref:Peptide chain release factor 2 n=2 Tax=Hathewaya proteolytica TaxID=29365 RepID=A0A1M6ND38_9CLOT|nr:bacterial peptide chain release factor 2 (bRF-2) [Hathewaya proteolytica DSM 3090]
MQEKNFWDDPEKATQITSEAKNLQDKINDYEGLSSRAEDLKLLTEMSIEGEDEESYNEIKKEYKELNKIYETMRIETLLNGEYDRNNAILTLHTGVGGNDAQDWTEMLMRMYTRWCDKKGFKIEILDYISADEAGIKCVTMRIIGEFAYGYLKYEMGVHRLVRISPYNANGKRQTSFASCEVIPELKEEQNKIEIDTQDLRIDTYRSSGAGGQHVNKTESAIRITHIPTGIVVQCQNERSQYSNKETAMNMLKGKLLSLKETAHKEKIEDLAGDQKGISWGSQIRSYVFHPYTLVKDHRSSVETSNINGVMDGDIDMFINYFLGKGSM